MKWIKCSERLPGRGVEVVVKDANGNVNQHFHHKNNKYYLMIELFGEERYAITDIIEWIDETDTTDEEAAFNASRSSEDGSFREIIFTYETFQDYQNSKNPQK